MPQQPCGVSSTGQRPAESGLTNFAQRSIASVGTVRLATPCAWAINALIGAMIAPGVAKA